MAEQRIGRNQTRQTHQQNNRQGALRIHGVVHDRLLKLSEVGRLMRLVRGWGKLFCPMTSDLARFFYFL